MRGRDTRFRLANNWSVFYKYDEKGENNGEN